MKELNIVETFGFCALFGHYDSRGGAKLYAGRLVDAAREYNSCFGTEEEMNGWGCAEDVAMLDFMGVFAVRFVGESPPKNKTYIDLLYDCNYTAFRLESTLDSTIGAEWGEDTEIWFIPNHLLDSLGYDEESELIEDITHPVWSTMKDWNYKYRLRQWDLGEDAFGCIWEDLRKNIKE